MSDLFCRDLALYDPNLKTSINGTVVPSLSTDYPSIIYIGDSYFESYATWPRTKFSHGFNLGKNGTTGMKTLLATVPLACRALKDGKLAYWEYLVAWELHRTGKRRRSTSIALH